MAKHVQYITSKPLNFSYKFKNMAVLRCVFKEKCRFMIVAADFDPEHEKHGERLILCYTGSYARVGPATQRFVCSFHHTLSPVLLGTPNLVKGNLR